jgi:hypothetical protein
MYRTSRNPMTLEDNELVMRAQKGEMVAFEELICRYDRRILGIALKFTNDIDQAQDLYQEIFLRVHNGLKQFKMESKFSTWLYRIATLRLTPAFLIYPANPGSERFRSNLASMFRQRMAKPAWGNCPRRWFHSPIRTGWRSRLRSVTTSARRSNVCHLNSDWCLCSAITMVTN